MSIIDISEPIRVGPKNLFMFNHFHCTSVLFLANVIESQIILFIERFHLFTCYVVSFDLHILLVGLLILDVLYILSYMYLFQI